MNPAPSIIVFTVLSGLGYGLAFMLGLGLLDPAGLATKLAFVAAIALTGAGLLASTLHLGNPQRFWRAFSQWRSSWLSREGVLAMATYVPLLWAAWASIFEDRTILAANLLLMAGAAATVFCTSMIYAQLKSVDAWHTPLTSAVFLAFSLAGGSIAALVAGAGSALIPVSIAAGLLAWMLKLRWRRRLKTLAPTSTPETATQLGALGAVRQFEPPHMTPNYLATEMMFRIGRKHADRLFRLAVGIGLLGATAFLLGAWLANGEVAAGLAVLALGAHLVGVALERWLFVAEARHAVSSFYRS